MITLRSRIYRNLYVGKKGKTLPMLKSISSRNHYVGAKEKKHVCQLQKSFCFNLFTYFLLCSPTRFSLGRPQLVSNHHLFLKDWSLSLLLLLSKCSLHFEWMKETQASDLVLRTAKDFVLSLESGQQ